MGPGNQSHHHPIHTVKTEFIPLSLPARKTQSRVYRNKETGTVVLSTDVLYSSQNENLCVCLRVGTDATMKPGDFKVTKSHPSAWHGWEPYDAPFRVDFYPLD